MPDDQSELVPPLPIPNRTVKRLHANDSADTRVKVGNRQAPTKSRTPPQGGVFALAKRFLRASLANKKANIAACNVNITKITIHSVHVFRYCSAQDAWRESAGTCKQSLAGERGR